LVWFLSLTLYIATKGDFYRGFERFFFAADLGVGCLPNHRRLTPRLVRSIPAQHAGLK